MEQIVVKTEMQPNEEILLFYVDEEDGTNEHGVVTTTGTIETQQGVQLQEDTSYLVQHYEEAEEPMEEEHAWSKDKWSDDETKRLLVFYVDNKISFLGGATTKKHLWTVACKTMLASKNHPACEMKLRNLKRKYTQMRIEQEKGYNVIWPYFQLCHQAFHDDKYVSAVLEEEKAKTQAKPVVPARVEEGGGIVVVKKVNSKHSGDGNVEAMLNLYLKYKKMGSHKVKQKDLWQNIAFQLGTEDGDYWHKRFLNFKNNYVRLLEKRNLEGPASISWPYMKLFDQIFEGDDMQKKHGVQNQQNAPARLEQYQQVPAESLEHLWNDTELTVLVKYYFDCYNEFQDKTIPNSFLWTEVGRLIDKNPDSCKTKYESLRAEHLEQYLAGGYEVRSRATLAILFDNIICKDVHHEIATKLSKVPDNDMWQTEELDELVQFLYENVEVFKDSVCYFVCWAAIAKKLRRTIAACRKQWQELTQLYKSILEDKKDDPDMQIDWRYIEWFDCIFVYGMDTNLLEGYEKVQDQKESERLGVKRVEIRSDDENEFDENISEDDESYDERGFMKRSKRRPGDSKSFKILEYYQKNKDKFNSPFRKKLALWEVLAKDIGISATQCAHRFRNLKQVYTKYVQREISKPEKPILWPYYAHCKKVFGYRAIKTKLRNGKKDTDDEDDWSAKEIKQLIVYFSQNFDDINSNLEDKSKWSALAAEIGKVEDACNDKLLELRKSYRKLKTMKTRNPDVKISWKYFGMFDDIYAAKENVLETVQEMEINGVGYEELNLSDIKMEAQDDDFQCIIVIPEGQDINDMSNAQIIMPENGELQPYLEIQAQSQQAIRKWTKKTKKTLLIHYINYLRMNKGKQIDASDMWREIAAKLGDVSPLSCRKMFAKLKANHLQLANEVDPNKKKTPYYTLLEKIVVMKPKFAKTGQRKSFKEEQFNEDVALPDDKVQQALQYYLEHVEEFVSPKIDNKYLWTELAEHISEPLNNIISKISYMKQNFDTQSGKIAGVDTPFAEYLQEILLKEATLANDIQNDVKPVKVEMQEESWTDDETEQLLSWYLANLEKFKNPKFVRSYLWMEASEILQKSALVCSKKMTEIRTQYKTFIKESPQELDCWKFYDLCQKIYGTGKRNAESMMMLDTTQNV